MCSLYEQENVEVTWLNRKQNMKVGLREVTDPATSPTSNQEDLTQTFMSGSQTHTTKHAHNPEVQNSLGTLRRPHGWDPHWRYALGVPAMGPFAPKVFPSLPLLYYAAEGPAPVSGCFSSCLISWLPTGFGQQEHWKEPGRQEKGEVRAVPPLPPCLS